MLIAFPSQSTATGNVVTAGRFARGLAARGLAVQTVGLPADDGRVLAEAVGRQGTQVLLLLHAFRTGRLWLHHANHVPAAVLLTGTDVHVGLQDPVQGPVIERVLTDAGRVLTQNAMTGRRLVALGKPWSGKVRYLPPSIALGQAACPPELKRMDGRLRLLMPASIRSIKANLELLLALDPVAASRPGGLEVVFCGPALEKAYFTKFEAALATRPHARYIGEISSACMPAVYREFDAVMNHSVDEGLSNAILEARAVGCPVLARINEGNQDAVRLVGGVLYRTDAELVAAVQHLPVPVRVPASLPSASDETGALIRALDEAVLADFEGCGSDGNSTCCG